MVGGRQAKEMFEGGDVSVDMFPSFCSHNGSVVPNSCSTKQEYNFKPPYQIEDDTVPVEPVDNRSKTEVASNHPQIAATQDNNQSDHIQHVSVDMFSTFCSNHGSILPNSSNVNGDVSLIQIGYDSISVANRNTAELDSKTVEITDAQGNNQIEQSRDDGNKVQLDNKPPEVTDAVDNNRIEDGQDGRNKTASDNRRGKLGRPKKRSNENARPTTKQQGKRKFEDSWDAKKCLEGCSCGNVHVGNIFAKLFRI